MLTYLFFNFVMSFNPLVHYYFDVLLYLFDFVLYIHSISEAVLSKLSREILSVSF